jgi:D-alanyl-lipoteichoic acid acyltransferase DltB (MBOAT superfamily)
MVAAVFYNLLRPVWWRQGALFLANLFFLATFASDTRAFLPFAAFLLAGYLGIQAAQRAETRRFFVPSLITIIAAFVWLKKYAFLPSGSFLHFAYVTIGMSYILFRVLHVMIDAHGGNLQAKISPLSYLNYTLNFMTLVSGPIQRFEDFAETQLAPERKALTIFNIGEGIHRIAVGFFKVAVLSWLLSLLQKDALHALFDPRPLPSKALLGAAVAALYPLYLYANFSGYTDTVIGIGRFFRCKLPENFDRPFSADNFINFWSRWHITLSNWLKTYVFNPLLLASMRRVTSFALEPFLAVLALFVTFFLVGVWHGQTSEFLVFGFLQGLGVAANQLYQILMEKRLGRERYRRLTTNSFYTAFSRGFTFTWFTFTLLWFWSNWTQMREITSALGVPAAIFALCTVFLAASVFLRLYGMVRDWAAGIRWNGSPVLVSRYALTVVDTGLTVITLAVVILLNAPAPDIVYRAF